MAKCYNVKIDFTAMRDRLAEIESGAPVRHLVCHTLHSAIACANVARIGAGLPAMRGPRSIPSGCLHMVGMPLDCVQVEIACLKVSNDFDLNARIEARALKLGHPNLKFNR